MRLFNNWLYPVIKAFLRGKRCQLNGSVLEHVVAATFSALPDAELLKAIKSGYDTDKWCKHLIVAAPGMQGVTKWDGLWFIGDHLVVPRVNSVHEYLY